ncbi:hypothetical protein V1512DRAFT_269395 [Lipomyces arxii]|uniref:uncharacterized protein n=1 Tax=Lipomyces arxii TaxID=56418 RepID=UPI0034CE8512
MSKPTYMITGAAQGLGYEMVRQLVESDVANVIAVVRPSSKIENLKKIVAKSPDAKIVTFDASDRAAIHAGLELLKAEGVDKIDVLINNAAMSQHAPMKSTSDSVFLDVLKTNIYGPQAVISEFLPLVAASSKKVIVTVSSSLASISMNSGYATGAYNISKAGVNMLMKQYSNEEASTGVIFVAIDPGWVKTEMGGADADLLPVESITPFLKTVDGLTIKDSGRFMDRFGKTVAY